jgi:hypothetical protein
VPDGDLVLNVFSVDPAASPPQNCHPEQARDLQSLTLRTLVSSPVTPRFSSQFPCDRHHRQTSFISAMIQRRHPTGNRVCLQGHCISDFQIFLQLFDNKCKRTAAPKRRPIHEARLSPVFSKTVHLSPLLSETELIFLGYVRPAKGSKARKKSA